MMRAFLLVSALLVGDGVKVGDKAPDFSLKNVDGKTLSLADYAEEFQVAYISAIDDSPNDPKKVQKRYIAEAIEALLTDKPIPVTETKAIGCSVKYRK